MMTHLTSDVYLRSPDSMMRRFLPLTVCAILLLPSAVAKQLTPSVSVTVVPMGVQGSIPQGAQRVTVLTLRLQATCDADVPVTAVTVRHAGLGSVQDFLRVYVLDGYTRVSATATVPARDPLSLRLRHIIVPACGTKTLTLSADFASDALSGGEHRFDLVRVDARGDVQVGSSSSSAANLRVTPHANQSSVELGFRPVLTDVSYGAHRIVSRMLVTGKVRDQELLSITFTNDGSASNADLQNLFLETSSQDSLSNPVAQMDGRIVRITFSPPFLLRRNQAVMLQLRADVRASRTQTIQWTIEDPTDVVARELRRS